MSSSERIAAYLERVCLHIRWRPYCARVRRELTDHILSRADYLQHDRGFSEEEAVAQAIRLMGDPEALGRSLNRAYRPYHRLLFFILSGLIWAAIVYCVIALLLQLNG